MKLIANISTIFAELPLCDRFYAARDAGFEGVEIQFPYDENLADIQNAVAKSGMDVELINLPAGERSAGDAGLAALPDRQEEFAQGMEMALHWAQELGVKKANVLAGKSTGAPYDAMFETFAANLARAAAAFAKIDVQVQLEVINRLDVSGFFAGDLEIGLSVIESVNHPNLKLQFDFYHMVRLGHSLVGAIEKAGSSIGHVQFADVPGCHQPGSGEIDFAPAIAALKTIGYDGAVSAEYFPSGNSADSLDWITAFKKLL